MENALGVAALASGVAQVASIAIAFWLGGRLLRRGALRRASPELLLGAHLLLTMGVGSLLLTGASLAAYAPERVADDTAIALSFSGNVVTIVGLMAALAFNARVFHAGRFGGWLVAGAGSAAMWAAFAHLFRDVDVETVTRFGAAYLPLTLSMLAADFWVAGEALHFRAQLRKRLALGLAEPLVVERLGLWSLGALARIALVSIAPVANALLETPQERQALLPALLTLSALLIASACIAYWLMLSPTQRYVRWVERRYAATAG